MTSEEQRAALAAHEALNRVADDVIAGRIGGAGRHNSAPPVAPPVAPPQVVHPEPEAAPQLAADPYAPATYAPEPYAPEPYAPPAQHYVEPQTYQQYAPVADTAEPAAPQEPAPQYYAPESYAPEPHAAEHPAPDHQDHYAQPKQPAEPALDPYAYTPEQQAAEQQAAEAYAAEFAASIAQTGVASATQQAQQATPEANAAPEGDFAPEMAAAVAALAAPPAVGVKQKRDRSSFLTWFFALVATIAIGVALYQGYLFHRTTEAMEKNVARTEISRTCRDIVGAYFEVKQKLSVLMPAADRGNIAGASRVTEANRLEAQAAITKFGGLSAYLANYQDVSARVRYSELTRALNGVMDVARTTPLTDLDRVFAPADKIFSSLNDDCVKTSSALRN